MNKIFVVIFLVSANLLYGQHIIKNLKWLNVEQEISELTVERGVTLYAETENIRDNEIVQITIWETDAKDDYLIGRYISRVEKNRIFFHWILDYNLNRAEMKKAMYKNGYTVQYYFTIQYNKTVNYNSGLLDVLAWNRTRAVYDGFYAMNEKYTAVLPDETKITGWTDAKGYINIEQKIWGSIYFYVHDKTGEYHEAEPGYQEPKKPVYYQVRRKDSLWKIASYDFVYGNPYLWKILYEANKNNFINNKNPDLIEIGQVLIIPSLKGETRNGTRDIE